MIHKQKKKHMGTCNTLLLQLATTVQQEREKAQNHSFFSTPSSYSGTQITAANCFIATVPNRELTLTRSSQDLEENYWDVERIEGISKVIVSFNNKSKTWGKKYVTEFKPKLVVVAHLYSRSREKLKLPKKKNRVTSDLLYKEKIFVQICKQMQIRWLLSWVTSCSLECLQELAENQICPKAGETYLSYIWNAKTSLLAAPLWSHLL